VAKVYPEPVVYGPTANDGAPPMISAMLLNELLKQTRKNNRQARLIETLSAKVAAAEASNRRALDRSERLSNSGLQSWSIQRRQRTETATRGGLQQARWTLFTVITAPRCEEKDLAAAHRDVSHLSPRGIILSAEGLLPGSGRGAAW
jgi:hypothetical protein